MHLLVYLCLSVFARIPNVMKKCVGFNSEIQISDIFCSLPPTGILCISLPVCLLACLHS